MEKTQVSRTLSSHKGVHNIRRGYEPDEEERGAYGEDVRLGLERSRLITESYKMTEGEPQVLRRAKALERILLNMTIYIGDQELIVGNYSESPNHLPHFIDSNWRSVNRLVNSKAGWTLTDDVGRAEFKKLSEYWDGRALKDIHDRVFTDEMKSDFKYEGTFLWSLYGGGGVPNYEKLLKVGLNGIISEVEAKLNEIGQRIPLDYFEQKDFLEAAIITLKAAIKFAGRFAEKARELAKSEQNEERRKQLEEIANICDRVPGNPARTLWEALQSFFFIHMITHQIEFELIGIGARLDILMNPFYVEDKGEGRITEEKALELLKCLWLKFEELGQMYSPTVGAVYGGGQLLQSLVIGGVDSEGKDVTNETSYLVLDAIKDVRTTQGSVCLRWNDETPKDFILKAIDVIRTGIGYPALFNDKSLIPLFQKWGFSLEDARNYVIWGCVYLNIPGKNMIHTPGGYFIFPKCLWWALHRGVNPKTGKQWGASTADPATFKCIEDVMDAFLEQVRFFSRKITRLENASRVIYRKYLPRPFLSSFLDGCIERGQDGRAWAYSPAFNHFIAVGPTNVVDSLAVLKKYVFEEKKISMTELIDVLDRNWEGDEVLRQTLLNQSPKYGNDNDYVDLIAKEVHYRIESILEECKSDFGVNFHWDGSGVSANYGLALECPATPDGRKDGEPFADATLSPSPGADVNGPTAGLASAAKIGTPFNELLNQKFQPQFLEGEYRELFYSYLKTWADLGIPHVQFNVVDRATLMDAQEHPEKHTDLIVRVAGYSAYFVHLSKGLQDHIIARTEQQLL